RAEQDKAGRTAFDIHRHGPAPARSHDDLRPVLFELGLGDADCCSEIVIRQRGIDDFVTVFSEVRRFDAPGNRSPAVDEEDCHGSCRIPNLSVGYVLPSGVRHARDLQDTPNASPWTMPIELLQRSPIAL